jgi:hypothetical protein
MTTKFKTFKTPNGEYGRIRTTSEDTYELVTFYTSITPSLFQIDTVMEDFKTYYTNDHFIYIEPNEDNDENYHYVKFDWDKHFPKTWKLITINISVE